MGMFDHVEYKAPCWQCGKELTDWQSKSGACMLKKLQPIQVRDFYTGCKDCGAWNEYWVEATDCNIIPHDGRPGEEEDET